jgi:hypothetical protein
MSLARPTYREVISNLTCPADIEQLVASIKYSFEPDPLAYRVIFKLSKDPLAMIKQLIDEEPLRGRPGRPGRASNTATEFGLLRYLSTKWQKYTVLLSCFHGANVDYMIQTTRRLELATRMILNLLSLLDNDRIAREMIHFDIISNEFLKFSESFPRYIRSQYHEFVAGRSLVTGNPIIINLFEIADGDKAILATLQQQIVAIDKTQVMLLFGSDNDLGAKTACWSVAVQDREAADNLVTLDFANLINPYIFVYGTELHPIHLAHRADRARYLIYHHVAIGLRGYFNNALGTANPVNLSGLARLLATLEVPDELKSAIENAL